MNPILLCLSILPLQSPTALAPSPVLEIVQQHVLSEMRKNSPNLVVNFGVASCPNVIHLEQGVASIRLFGATSTWSGEKHIAYTEALAARPIDFGLNLAEPSLLPAISSSATRDVGQPSTWKPGVLWAGAALIAAGAIYYLHKSGGTRTQSSENRNELRTGIKF